jgi:Putative phage holin Dp-1
MTEVQERDHLLTNEVYDKLKHLAQIGLPAAGTLYFTLAQLWGLPNAEAVVGTIMAIDAFLGILLGYATKSYNNSAAKYDGTIEIEETEDRQLFSLNLNGDPENLNKQKQVVFKVSSTKNAA